MISTLRYLLVLLPWLTGCVVYDSQYFVAAEDLVLASKDGPNAARLRYELALRSSSGDAVLVVHTSRTVEVPVVGVEVEELNKERAEQRGVAPFAGVLVKSVRTGSVAAAAGFQAGDVLLRAGDAPVVYRGQWQEIVSGWRVGAEVPCQVLRGQQELTLPLVVGGRVDTVTTREEVALEVPTVTLPPYAGVTLRGIPPAYTEQMFGSRAPAVVVSAVEVGSPAWLAGVRGGDMVQSVDGQATPDVHQLVRDIAARGAEGRSMQWVVVRGSGAPFTAELALREYREGMRIWVPFVFWLDQKAETDQWTAGPLGLLVGNRNQYVADTRTRQVKTRNIFHAVLGLVHIDSAPDRTRVRLLWFIQFDR
jgi:hypothetical protein